MSYNLLNLPSKAGGMAGSGNAGLTLSYSYLSDGTKTSSECIIGDNGRALSKAERQIKDLQDKVNNSSSRHERDKLEQKIKNVKQYAAKKEKGEEHSRGNKH